MLRYITVLLVCQLAGEVMVRLAGLPVPGPVIGMLILFGGLAVRGRTPADLSSVASGILRWLSLLFVPAGVGIIVHLRLLASQLLPIASSVLVGTLVTIGLTGWLMQTLNRRRNALPPQQALTEKQP